MKVLEEVISNIFVLNFVSLEFIHLTKTSWYHIDRYQTLVYTT